MKQLPENEKFELTVLNPAGVFGPVLCGGLSASQEVRTNLTVKHHKAKKKNKKKKARTNNSGLRAHSFAQGSNVHKAISTIKSKEVG